VKHKYVNPGDQFRKMDSGYPREWVVLRVMHSPGVPTHYVLRDVQDAANVRTISEPTLLDPEFYRPLARATVTDSAVPDDAAPCGAEQRSGQEVAVGRDESPRNAWDTGLGLSRAR